MADVIELGILHDRVAQIDTDVGKDTLGAGIIGFHQLLNHLQFLGRGQGGVQRNTGPGRQLDDRVLREVFTAHADITGPFVGHGVLIQVNGGKGKLVDPAQHLSVLVDIANGLAGAHGDAHERTGIHAHGAGQRGHVSVVGDHNRHIADGCAGPVIDGFDFVPAGAGNLNEQGGDHGRVADKGTGGGYADGVHPGHFGCGGFEGVQNLLVVVVGVGLGFREPDDLLGIDAFAVDHSGNLPIGTAGVKANATAVQMAADGHGVLVGGRRFFVGQVDHFQIPLIELLYEVKVKGAFAVGLIGAAQLLRQLGAAADVDPEATDGVEQEFDDPLHIAVIGIAHFGSAVNSGVSDGDMSFVPFHGDGQRNGSTLLIVLHPDAEGNEAGVQNGGVLHVIMNA